MSLTRSLIIKNAKCQEWMVVGGSVWRVLFYTQQIEGLKFFSLLYELIKLWDYSRENFGDGMRSVNGVSVMAKG